VFENIAQHFLLFRGEFHVLHITFAK
jgi:hypothetical protein